VGLGKPENVQASQFPRDITGAGGMAQVIEHLPSKHEDLRLSHSTVKKTARDIMTLSQR
jgi:hypothetical protein